MAPSAEDLECELLARVGAADAAGALDSGDLAAALGVEHNVLVGVLKSLEAAEMVAAADVPHARWALTPGGCALLGAPAPEAQVFAAVPAAGGVPLADLKAALGKVADAGFAQAMQRKWVAVDRSGGAPVVVRAAAAAPDALAPLLAALAAGGGVPADTPPAELASAARRKLVAEQSWTTFSLGKGPKWALERRRPATDLTAEMLRSGAWRDAEFKAYNFAALGAPPAGGALHPLLKVRSQFRKIFTQMGFEEMPTNAWVESSFWNFDALFQPQAHPARDAHDTFFLTHPAATPLADLAPPAYLAAVRAVHERGGHGSAGYGSEWRPAEAAKNLLRTHTTAVSSRMLHRLAADGFQPARYFSIDRVFRNEAVDRTHLAEFHQVEGLVCGEGLTLGHLVGVLREFFGRLGLGSRLRFKPAYNPYTEPSMEIFSYSDELGKWVEVGNSGMFRPEMLRPMGLPEGVTVIAWGLSLERPTMILYGIGNIRDLFGHRMSLAAVRRAGVCRMGYAPAPAAPEAEDLK
jgi:phenylalanyl-tRNA synthetase alpha chain